MPQLFGRHYTRAELERRVGRLDQIAGITPLELVDGRSHGVRAFNVATGSGFAFTAIADRALDVAAASYQGMALSWLSRNGIVAPAYYEPHGDAFFENVLRRIVHDVRPDEILGRREVTGGGASACTGASMPLRQKTSCMRRAGKATNARWRFVGQFVRLAYLVKIFGWIVACVPRSAATISKSTML